MSSISPMFLLHLASDDGRFAPSPFPFAAGRLPQRVMTAQGGAR
jgi:hypothetical protein